MKTTRKKKPKKNKTKRGKYKICPEYFYKEGIILKNQKYKEYIANLAPGIGYGLVCGAVVGTVIFFFKLLAKYAENASRYLYGAAKDKPLYIVLVFAALVGFALLMVLLHKLIPEAKGGGIPRSEGVLRGILSFRWLKTFIGTFLGSMISFFSGLPLGSEGPAVLIGTSLGAMCTSPSKNRAAWDRYVMTGGAGAGFAVATGAPLSGILFALEEIHKRFTPMLVLTVSVSVLSATGVNRLLCELFGISADLFKFETLAGFELNNIGYLILLGVIIALAAGIFDTSIELWGRFAKKRKRILSAPAKIIAIFILTGIMGFTLADGIYSGHDVIHSVVEHTPGVLFLLALFAIRLVMMLLVTDSGVTGGIFIPTLAVGVLASALASKLLILIGMPEELLATVIILGMCAFIGGTLRAPLTASVLYIELTGQFTDLFYVALVVFTVSALTELLARTPFYDTALENLEHAQNGGKEPSIALFEMKVSNDAFVVGKAVRDVMWPSSSVVLSITRESDHHKDTDNDGEKKLLAGDSLILRSRFFDEEELKKTLRGLVGNDYEIIRKEM